MWNFDGENEKKSILIFVLNMQTDKHIHLQNSMSDLQRNLTFCTVIGQTKDYTQTVIIFGSTAWRSQTFDLLSGSKLCSWGKKKNVINYFENVVLSSQTM